MTTPTVELVPGDDFSLTVTLTDSDGNAIDYSGWSVHTAEITWSDDTTTTLTVDLTNADTGVFVLTCADTDTDGKRLGLVHELRLKLQSGAGLEKTVYYAEVKGVETLTSDTATGFVPGLSAGQVKELYEANSDTNAFTDAEQTKLSGIETGATADQTGAEIKALYEAEADTNAFTDAEKTKLAGIEASADVTDAANVAAAGAVMDGDFATNGLMKRTGAGTYDIVTDNSANWNTAYGWGDHAVEGYLTSVAVDDLTDWPASVSATEVGYLDGVTSAIQTQLNGKAASSHSHAATDITTGTIADARLPARLGTVGATVTDWDDVTEPGFYTSYLAANEPSATAWIGMVNSRAGTRIEQELVALHSGAGSAPRYIRASYDGGTTWDAWVQVFKTQPVLDARYAQLSGAAFTGNISATGTIAAKLPPYTVATAPSASASGAGFQIYITDETGGAVPAFSDGTDWRRVTDRSVIA